jgi:hypothetical protein
MRTTRFRRILLLAGAMLFLSASTTVPALAAVEAGPGAPVPAPAYRDSFEFGWDGWKPDTDGLARDWSISHSTKEAYDGRVSLAFYLDGRNDDGTIWIERPFAVTPGAIVYVEASFWLHSAAPSVTAWPVVGYAGPQNPKSEADLPRIDLADRVQGWMQYRFADKFQADATGTAWVALGISATWEVARTYYVDLVETSVTVWPKSP